MKTIVAIFFVAVLLNTNSNPNVAPTIHTVKIIGMKFVPETIEINKGETVRWINVSDQSHNVVAKDKTFKSAMLSPNDNHTFEHTFESTGKFDYYCQPHRIMGMTGIVIVKDLNP